MGSVAWRDEPRRGVRGHLAASRALVGGRGWVVLGPPILPPNLSSLGTRGVGRRLVNNHNQN